MSPKLPLTESSNCSSLLRFTVLSVYDHAGVWDVMSNIEVVEFVRKKIASNMKPPEVSC